MKTLRTTVAHYMYTIAISAVVLSAGFMVYSHRSVQAATGASPCVQAVPEYADRCYTVLSYVHRGGETATSATTIENTLTAFQQSYVARNDGVEADLWPLQENGVKASSNVLAYNHDRTVGRTIDAASLTSAGVANKNAQVITITPTQWNGLRTKGGAAVSTFQPVTQWACSQSTEFRTLNEIKYAFKDPSMVMQQIKTANCAHQIWFYQAPNAAQGCSLKGLDALSAASTKSGVVAGFGIKYLPQCPMTPAQMRQHGTFVTADWQLLTPEWVAQLHAAGLNVMPNGSGGSDQWATLIRNGVGASWGDALITLDQHDLATWLGN